MRKLTLLFLLVVSSAWGLVAEGQAATPVRSARLTFFAGAVDVQQADNTAAEPPVLNMPLGEGTRLICGDYGQLELEFEDGSVVRVAPRSTLTLDVLTLEGDRARTQMTLLSGIAYFELRKSEQARYGVSAGGVTFSPEENSLVRVTLADGPATFAVMSGSARVEHKFSAVVRAGESLHADAKDETRYFLTDHVELESWDSWNAERDRAATNEGENRTSARDQLAGVQGYGWSDLDANGTWYDVEGEGQVWQPAAADEQFDPYGYGNWVWQNTGFVWASGYSWGWVPFRCGRWEFLPGIGWVWKGDGGCGRWGAEGGRLLIGRRRPPHYREPPLPLKPPSKVHPVIVVRDKDGPRPALPGGGLKTVGGTVWRPLPRLGVVSAGGLALDRDFPVNAKTHEPVAGVLASTGGISSSGARPGAAYPEARAGGRTEHERPPVPGGRAAPEPVSIGRGLTPVSGEFMPVKRDPTAPANSRVPVAEPSHNQAPVRMAPPVVAPVVSHPPPMPVLAQPRPAPAPAPAPVRALVATPAPAKADPAKPKS